MTKPLILVGGADTEREAVEAAKKELGNGYEITKAVRKDEFIWEIYGKTKKEKK